MRDDVMRTRIPLGLLLRRPGWFPTRYLLVILSTRKARSSTLYIQTYCIASIAARVGHGIQRLNGTSRKFLDHDPLRFPQPEMRLATSDHPHTVLRQRCNPGVRTTAAC